METHPFLIVFWCFQVAQKARDFRLAVLLSQAIGPTSERDLVLKQLELWVESKYVGDSTHRDLISEDRWKVSVSAQHLCFFSFFCVLFLDSCVCLRPFNSRRSARQYRETFILN